MAVKTHRVHYPMEPEISSSHSAARIDALLEQVAAEYRAFPAREHLPLAFREALGRLNLPGGLRSRGAQARPLSQSLQGEV